MISKAQHIANTLRAVSGSDKRIKPTSAVIVAGGRSTRMGGEILKQHRMLGGLPVVVRTLKVFEACELIQDIVVVTLPGEIPLYESYREQYGLTKLHAIVPGGDTRQQSVLCGFEAISRKSEFVAIHDAVRCLVTEQMIEAVCLTAYKTRAATAATAVRDTVKISDGKGNISGTTDRNTVWLAQTPQVFNVTLYRAAAYTAREAGFEATDDNSLVERIDNPIRLVECGSENIKLTTPEDISLAEEILAARRRRKAGGLSCE